MKEKILLGFGFLLIGIVGVSWFLKGFDGFYIFLMYLSWLCFTNPDQILKVFNQIKTYSPTQFFLIIIALLLSVGVALGIILTFKYVMEDMLHLKGAFKIIMQYVIVIIALIPSTLLFVKTLQYINEQAKKQS